jgi:uncharacterized hydrophobic protein (TIGR00271 family)
MLRWWLSKDEANTREALTALIGQASPRADFFGMVGMAVVMASLGMVMNNETVIIGSMLIAPIIFPILTLALGVVVMDGRLVLRSVVTLIKAMAVSVGMALLVGLFLRLGGGRISSLAVSRSEPSVLYVMVAVVAGMAATLAYFRERVKDYQPLPGVAISVALIPPLAAAGFGAAFTNWKVFWGGLGVFGMNVLGIVVTAMIVFLFLRIGNYHGVIGKEVVKDEKEVEKEESGG